MKGTKHFNQRQFPIFIETPKGSKVKYSFDAQLKSLVLDKELPDGMQFPFAFGFIPGTIGEDGDPLDALVLMKPKSTNGCFIKCRLIGAVLGTDQEGKEKPYRNDRFIFVPAEIEKYDNIKSLQDLTPGKLKRIKDFLIEYQRGDKKFTILNVVEPRDAGKEIRKALK